MSTGDVHGALQLREILLRVLEYLADDEESLLRAILVNKTWAEEGTNVRWREPLVKHLASVSESRRPIYAEKVYTLSFAGDSDSIHHEVFRHLRFPRLKRLQLDSFQPRDGRRFWIHQYLQPSLEVFEFYGGELAEHLLDALASQCPRLRKIIIDNPHNQLDPERFLGFLKQRQSLQSMTFLYGMDGLVTNETFLYLAGRDNLESLYLGRSFDRAIIEDVLERTLDSFKHLQRLFLSLESNAVPSLLSALKSVTQLGLEIEDDKRDVLPIVASMKTLRTLEVTFRRDQVLSSASILALGSLTQLHKLVIQPSPSESADLRAATLADQDFIQLVSKLRHLQDLKFEVQCDLSVAAIHSLGVHCASLESCEMLGSYELQALDDTPTPLFPQLRVLELGSAQANEREER